MLPPHLMFNLFVKIAKFEPISAQPLTSRFSNDKPVEVNTDIQFPISGENTGGPARRYGRQQRDIQFPDSMETWESIQQRKLSGHLLAYFNSQNRNYRQASSEELSADSYEELSAESSEEILFSANTENLEARGCGDKSYCEDSTFYPESYVVNLLETNSKIPPGIVNKFVKEGFKILSKNPYHIYFRFKKILFECF